jgi:hypothetical protein
MGDDPENLTLRVLQELREEMRHLRIEMQETKEAVRNRVDGNTPLLTMVAGLVRDHENRIDKLESR